MFSPTIRSPTDYDFEKLRIFKIYFFKFVCSSRLGINLFLFLTPTFKNYATCLSLFRNSNGNMLNIAPILIRPKD